MPINVEEENRLLFEACELYRPHGFTTVALVENNKIGRLCALRCLDEKNSTMNLHLIQFYNTINLPLVELECQIPIENVTAEGVTWIGNRVAVGCSDGSVIFVSPFTQEIKRVQIFASGIVALCSMDDTLVLASESAELQFVDVDDELNTNVRKSIKFPSNQRIIFLSASSSLSTVAVNMLSSVTLVNVLSWKQESISITKDGNKATVIWSALFVKDHLFTGDSRGVVTIHNAKTGSLIKSIRTHEADVMALTTNGENVFASGVDYRIQVLANLVGSQGKLEWTTVGQRIFHHNDVRTMCSIGPWLISGGKEHKIVVSNKNFDVYYSYIGKSCNVTNEHILLPYLNYVHVWKRENPSMILEAKQKPNHKSTEHGPRKILELAPPSRSLILQSALSNNSTHLALLTVKGLYVYKLNSTEENTIQPKRLIHLPVSKRTSITAMAFSESHLFFARGNAELVKLDFKTLNTDIVAIQEANACVIRLHVSSDGQICLAKSSRSQLFVIDLKNEDLDVDERFLELDFDQSVSEFRLIGTSTVLLFVAGLHSSIHFIDMKSMKSTKTPIDLTGMFGPREMATDISEVVGDTIVVHGNRDNCCIVDELTAVRSFVSSTAMPLEEEDESKKRKSNWSAPVMPPVSSEVHLVSNGTGEKSTILITNRPLNPPTCVPMQIRRFNRN
ncbi:Cirhin [Aphelenchoides besseyi]|nr:Cirhin [Aphelenchoides besseyi]